MVLALLFTIAVAAWLLNRSKLRQLKQTQLLRQQIANDLHDEVNESTLGNIRTGISRIGVYYRGERETQQIGIVPDKEVMPTIKGISAGRDELLEEALEVVKTK